MDVPGVSGEGRINGRAQSEQWLSFECRMRRRRVARCLLRADLALDDGHLAEAAAALEEARLLDGETQEIAALEQRRLELEAATLKQPPVAETPPPPNDPLLHPPAIPSITLDSDSGVLVEPRRRTWIPVAAAALLVLGGTAYSALYWFKSGVQATDVTAATPASPPVSTAGIGVATATKPAPLRIVRETIAAPVDAPQLVGDLPTLPPFPAPPIAEPESTTEATPVVLALNRSEPGPLPTLPDVRRTEVPLDARTSAATPEPPVRAAVSNPPPAAAAVPPPVPTPRAEPAPVVDDTSVVRSVLARYEVAYSRLDASAAKAVWPKVDRGALARAFEGLASQRVSLDSCDVMVNGPAARATCSGTATWVPKIGGGVRTEARRWNFELRKLEEGWQIESARIR